MRNYHHPMAGYGYLDPSYLDPIKQATNEPSDYTAPAISSTQILILTAKGFSKSEIEAINSDGGDGYISPIRLGLAKEILKVKNGALSYQELKDSILRNAGWLALENQGPVAYHAMDVQADSIQTTNASPLTNKDAPTFMKRDIVDMVPGGIYTLIGLTVFGILYLMRK